MFISKLQAQPFITPYSFQLINPSPFPTAQPSAELLLPPLPLSTRTSTASHSSIKGSCPLSTNMRRAQPDPFAAAPDKGEEVAWGFWQKGQQIKRLVGTDWGFFQIFILQK